MFVETERYLFNESQLYVFVLFLFKFALRVDGSKYHLIFSVSDYYLFAADDKITTAGYDSKALFLLTVQWKIKVNDKLVCLGGAQIWSMILLTNYRITSFGLHFTEAGINNCPFQTTQYTLFYLRILFLGQEWIIFIFLLNIFWSYMVCHSISCLDDV